MGRLTPPRGRNTGPRPVWAGGGAGHPRTRKSGRDAALRRDIPDAGEGGGAQGRLTSRHEKLVRIHVGDFPYASGGVDCSGPVGATGCADYDCTNIIVIGESGRGESLLPDSFSGCTHGVRVYALY